MPIPGTRSTNRLHENIGAVDPTLTADDLDAIADALDELTVLGDRYDESQQATIDR